MESSSIVYYGKVVLGVGVAGGAAYMMYRYARGSKVNIRNIRSPPYGTPSHIFSLNSILIALSVFITGGSCKGVGDTEGVCVPDNPGADELSGLYCRWVRGMWCGRLNMSLLTNQHSAVHSALGGVKVL